MARTTKVETQVAIHVVEIKELKKRFDSFDEKLDAMALALAKNKGFWGAVTLITGAIWMAVTSFGSQIISMFTGGR